MTVRSVAPPCSSGKPSHPTRGAAERALLRIRQDQAQAVAPTANPPRWSYRCRECRQWHLTSKPPRA